MATYITLANYTEQGMRTIKDSPARLDAARTLASDLGGTLGQFCLTLGAYGFVVVSEFPDDEAAAKFALAVGSMGNVRTTTLKAFPEADYRRIIQELP